MRERLPPGQRWIDGLIIYDIAPVPPLDLKDFRLRLFGEVEEERTLTWNEFLGLPQTQVRADFHCVEGWSVPDLLWEGVSGETIVRLVRPKPGVAWVVAYGRDGYSTNLPFSHFTSPTTILAHSLNGKPLPSEHGWPLRLVVPSLYAWKSAKYLVALEFRRDLKRGYWEERGYHDVGDPWRQQRRR